MITEVLSVDMRRFHDWPSDLYGINGYFPGRTTFEEVQTLVESSGRQLEKVTSNGLCSVWTTHFAPGEFAVGDAPISTAVFYFSRGVLSTIGGTFEAEGVPSVTRAFTTLFGFSSKVWRNSQSEALVDVKPGTTIASFRIIHIASQKQFQADQRAAGKGGKP